MTNNRNAGGNKPERNVVHAREGHIRCADHEWHKPVAKPANHCRHDQEEDHDQTVGRGEHIEQVLACVLRHFRIDLLHDFSQPGEKLQSRLMEFDTHRT